MKYKYLDENNRFDAIGATLLVVIVSFMVIVPVLMITTLGIYGAGISVDLFDSGCWLWTIRILIPIIPSLGYFAFRYWVKEAFIEQFMKKNPSRNEEWIKTALKAIKADVKPEDIWRF